jgi:signal transduction histidine kinase
MRVTLGKKLFLYTSCSLVLLLLVTFFILERNQARQWEDHLHAQSLAFVRFATPELLKLFRGAFPPQQDETLVKVSEFLAFNRDLAGFSLFSPGGRMLYRSPLFGSFADRNLYESLRERTADDYALTEPRLHTLVLPGGGRVLELTAPAFGPTGGQVLAVRYLISYDSVDRRLAEMRDYFLRIALSTLVCSLPLVALAARRVTRPIKKLTERARAVARGDLESRIHIRNRDEIGVLATAFNDMSESLSVSRTELTDKNRALIQANADLHRIQEQLIRAERLAAIGQLAAGVSHEIDNPVGIILGYAELLQADMAEDDDRRQDVEAIIAECRRCRRITGGLLGLARSGPVRRELVNIGELVAGTVSSLRPQKLFKGIATQISAAQPLPPILVDPDQIRQVLVNLLLNAAQAMEGDGDLVVILGLEEKQVVLYVDDSGPGVSEELQSRVFDPFFSTKGTGEGTGLGLSVCRKLMEDQGGVISVGRSPAGGARFRLAFPLADAEKCFDNCRDDF